MKISKRDIQLLLGLVGVIAIIVVYQFVYVKTNEKTEVLKAENQTLESTVKELEALTVLQEKFEEETTAMAAMTEAYKGMFPSDYKTEDGIMMAVDLENTTGMFISNISVGNMEALYEQGKGTLEDGQGTETEETGAEETSESAEKAPEKGVLYKGSLDYTFESGNDGLKNGILFVQAQPERKNIESLSVSYDKETGKLSGNMNINVYALTGTGKEYVPPVVPYTEIGTSNIFGTVETQQVESTENTNES